jgi:hypothetical protein
MSLFKNPFNNEKSVAVFELALLRAYIVFEIATKFLVLSVEQIREAVQKLGDHLGNCWSNRSTAYVTIPV